MGDAGSRWLGPEERVCISEPMSRVVAGTEDRAGWQLCCCCGTWLFWPSSSCSYLPAVQAWLDEAATVPLPGGLAEDPDQAYNTSTALSTGSSNQAPRAAFVQVIGGSMPTSKAAELLSKHRQQLPAQLKRQQLWQPVPFQSVQRSIYTEACSQGFLRTMYSPLVVTAQPACASQGPRLQ